MIASSRQLMDRIKNLVGNDSTRAQTAMRLYAMERFLDRARIPMKLDFSTDDAITPGAVELGYPRLLENGEIPIMAYNLETLLAEKLETVISRGVTNTRMRDFYDIFALLEAKGGSIETPILRAAIKATFAKRETDPSPENARLVLSEVQANGRMGEMWSRYQSKSDYAGGSHGRMPCARPPAS